MNKTKTNRELAMAENLLEFGSLVEVRLYDMLGGCGRPEDIIAELKSQVGLLEQELAKTNQMELKNIVGLDDGESTKFPSMFNEGEYLEYII